MVSSMNPALGEVVSSKSPTMVRDQSEVQKRTVFSQIKGHSFLPPGKSMLFFMKSKETEIEIVSRPVSLWP